MYLIDSNIVIYYFGGVMNAHKFLNDNVGNLAISTITVSEVLSGALETEVESIQKFLQENFKWIDVSRDVILKSAQIRRQKKTKTPDAIIAATALIHDCTLVTRNQKDFTHLPLTFINPIDE